MFIQQFADVQAAIEWNGAAALLHLRSCLRDDAVDSGTGATTDKIFTNLQARFGLNTRQAHDKLSALQRMPGQSLQALGLEAERLENAAYPDIPADVRTSIAIDTFGRVLDDRHPKKHILLAGAETLAGTVRHAEEFLQVGARSD